MTDSFVELVRGIRIGDEYQLVKLIGSGSFGKVYLGRNIKTSEEVAIKLEHHEIPYPSLCREGKTYYDLGEDEGFPLNHWHGNHDDYYCLVMDMLGPTLEDLLRYCGGTFSLKTTLMLADQLLHRFEYLHRGDYLHCDVKPENFLMGTGRNGNTVYMTDLGLALWRNPDLDRSKAEHSDKEPPTSFYPYGTCSYASIKGHISWDLSQKDDLQSLGYLLVYFMKGRLPWSGIRKKSKGEKYRKVYETKCATSPEDLSEDLPSAFVTYFEYCASEPDHLPDYNYLRQLFVDLFFAKGFVYDNVFDWTILLYQQLQDDKRRPDGRNRCDGCGRKKKKQAKTRRK